MRAGRGAGWYMVEELLHRNGPVTLKEEEGRIKMLASKRKKAYEMH